MADVSADEPGFRAADYYFPNRRVNHAQAGNHHRKLPFRAREAVARWVFDLAQQRSDAGFALADTGDDMLLR